VSNRLTANVSFLFEEFPFIDRFDAAYAAGFGLVECHFPYGMPVDVLKGRLEKAAVRLTGINTSPGDAGAGEWGLGGVPGRQRDFIAHFDEALRYACRLGSNTIHVMAGVVESSERPAARETLLENLKYAAARARDEGITLLLEPLNKRDRPGYLLSTTDEVAEIIASAGARNLALLFDIYHVQIMEGDLTTRLERYRDIIGHVQISAVPDRGEPDCSEVALGHILGTLDAIGYSGLIGLEYRPRGSTTAGLGWIEGFASALRK